MKLEEVVSSEWHDCGSVLFQWDNLYDMVWEDPQLRNMRVAAAQFGGPIAVVRDSRKMVQVRGALHPVVRIFNCGGKEKAQFPWTGGVTIGMGWTADEQLLLVDAAGDVAVFDIHGQRLPNEFSLGTACMQERLLDCIVYRGGIVALTYENSLWAITDLTEVRPQRLADLEVGANPQCMSLRVSQAHGIEVILACEEILLVVDSYQAVKYEPEIGIVTSMTVSPNGELIMAYTEENTLEVLTSDMTHILRFEPPIDTRPLQMAWCANDFLVMVFEDVLLLVESEGQFTSFSVDGPVHMVAEKDCLRVFTEKKHLLLRVVSDAMTNVLSSESDHPSRELYLARQAYDAQDAKADKLLRDMKDQLPEAIHGCIQLASRATLGSPSNERYCR